MLASALITDPISVLVVLLATLAGLFTLQHTRFGAAVYKVVPLLVFCYFVPTLLSNVGLIPTDPKNAIYLFTKDWLLPASLFLLVLAVDIKAFAGLGRNVVILFFVSVLSIMLAGPLAYLLLGGLFDAEHGEQIWRGLAALSGSWIGGGANMTAVKESVEASDSILAAIVVVDVFIAELWTATLFIFAAREKRMDAKIGADRSSLDQVRSKIEDYQVSIRRPTDTSSLLQMLALAFGATLLAKLGGDWLAATLPENDIMGAFAWKVVLITMLGLALSFTRVRRLEGAGASSMGSVLLYLLVATIGAKAEFAEVASPQNLPLVAVGALWMILHIAVLLIARRMLKAPIFFAGVASKSCIGGAASAPIVAAAFHPPSSPSASSSPSSATWSAPWPASAAPPSSASSTWASTRRGLGPAS
jgi:uncharacterized membrane protein